MEGTTGHLGHMQYELGNFEDSSHLQLHSIFNKWEGQRTKYENSRQQFQCSLKQPRVQNGSHEDSHCLYCQVTEFILNNFSQRITFV